MGMAWRFFLDSKGDIIGYTDILYILYKQRYLDFDDFGDMFAHSMGIYWKRS